MNWIAFITYALVSSITPGPNNIMSMSNGSRYGFKNSLRFNMGLWCGFTIVSVCCMAFCSILSQFVPIIKMPMLIIGAAYILYLAWKTFKSTGNLEEKQGINRFWPAFALQFVNPKLYVYCIVSMEAYILPYYAGNVPVLLAFSVLLSTLGFSCSLLWLAFGSAFKKLFAKHAKTVNIIMSLLLVYCAVALFI